MPDRDFKTKVYTTSERSQVFQVFGSKKDSLLEEGSPNPQGFLPWLYLDVRVARSWGCLVSLASLDFERWRWHETDGGGCLWNVLVKLSIEVIPHESIRRHFGIYTPPFLIHYVIGNIYTV